jgi:hypothetical protein
MFRCEECGATTPDECRKRHARTAQQRADRENAWREIRARIEAMSDAEFRAFNARLIAPNPTGETP